MPMLVGQLVGQAAQLPDFSRGSFCCNALQLVAER